MKRLSLFSLVLLAHSALAADFKPFQSGSRAAIEQAHAGQPFVLAFWSVDCAYCPDEIKHLSELTRTRRDIKLVLVSVDGDDFKGEAAKKLAAWLPEGQGERWLFAGNDAERLFFAVDRQWYGELPRTYFYDGKGGVQGKSGRVSTSWLMEWARSVARE